MNSKKPNQVRWTIATGTGQEGEERLERWLKAAVIVYEDPKLLNAWIRRVLDTEAEKVITKKR